MERPLGDGANSFGEGPKVSIPTGSLLVQQVRYEGAGCGAVADLLGRELLGGEQGAKRLIILVPLAVAARYVNEKQGAALQDGELYGMHALGVLDGDSPVAKGDGRRDAMDVYVCWTERGEPVVGIATQAARYGVGFAE